MDVCTERAIFWKRCSMCGALKQSTEFYSAPSKDGVQSRCKLCTASAATQWRANNPERQAEYSRRAQLRRYDITLDDYRALFTKQDGRCAICRQPETWTTKGRQRLLPVDHDHSTGAVRGLLCNDCNTALGLFRDDPERLRSAADYLEASHDT